MPSCVVVFVEGQFSAIFLLILVLTKEYVGGLSAQNNGLLQNLKVIAIV